MTEINNKLLLNKNNAEISFKNLNSAPQTKKSGDSASFRSVLDKTMYLKAPQRSDYKNVEEFYEADNKYVQQLLEKPYALPDIKNYELTRPEKGVSRSTDVYDCKIEDNMIKYLGRNGDTVWQVFVPNLHWHQTSHGNKDSRMGDAYSRNLSRFAIKTVFYRGEQMGDSTPVLDGVFYDGGKAHRQFQHDLYNKYADMVARVNTNGMLEPLLDKKDTE